MNTWIYILIGIIVLIIIAIKIIKRASGIPVLKVKIGTTDGIVYNVEFKELHTGTKKIEYVRMVLHFIAQILFIMEKRDLYLSEEIVNYINEVSNKDKQIGTFTGIQKGIAIKEDKAEGKVIGGVLYFKNVKIRSIITKLPVTWFELQLFHSIVALIKVSVENLDDFHRNYLKESLKYMADLYTNRGVNPRERNNLISVPNEAFYARYITKAESE